MLSYLIHKETCNTFTQPHAWKVVIYFFLLGLQSSSLSFNSHEETDCIVLSGINTTGTEERLNLDDIVDFLAIFWWSCKWRAGMNHHKFAIRWPVPAKHSLSTMRKTHFLHYRRATEAGVI
jgi:hypothetical protein